MLVYSQYYVASFSKTEKDDKDLRLSMWRAYGGKAGVALVFTEGFFQKLQEVVSELETLETGPQEKLLHFCKAYYPEQVAQDKGELLKQTEDPQKVRSIIPFIKHAGFQEEKEYRLIAFFNCCLEMKKKGTMEEIKNKAKEQASKILEKKRKTLEKYGLNIGFTVEVIHGIPQVIAEFFFSIDDIDHLVIGPTIDRSHAEAIKTSLTKMLMTKKIEKEIHISDIPLRRY